MASKSSQRTLGTSYLPNVVRKSTIFFFPLTRSGRTTANRPMSWLTVPPVFDMGLRSPSGPVKAFVRRCPDKLRSRPVGTDQSPSSRIYAAPRPKDGAACVHVDQPLRAFKGSKGLMRRQKGRHSSRPATPNVPAPWRGFAQAPRGWARSAGSRAGSRLGAAAAVRSPGWWG